mmetsp:Transcript_14608/g.29955  ORF Transcript_14608/g.29955 Transcript_14608/m.29955 type:complete len:1037 (-) Transcript_14608:8-3118(-)
MSTREADYDDIHDENSEDISDDYGFDFRESPIITTNDKKKKKQYGASRVSKYSSTATSGKTTAEMQGNDRFKKKRKNNPRTVVDRSRSGTKSLYYEEGIANKFSTLGLPRTPSTAPNRRGKRDRESNWLESQSLDASPDRMAGKQSVCNILDVDDISVDSSEPEKKPCRTTSIPKKEKKKKKQSENNLTFVTANKTKNADSALDRADKCQQQHYKKSGQRGGVGSGQGFAALNGTWMSKTQEQPSQKGYAKKKSGSRSFEQDTPSSRRKNKQESTRDIRDILGSRLLDANISTKRRNESSNRRKNGSFSHVSDGEYTPSPKRKSKRRKKNDTSIDKPIDLCSSSEEEEEFDEHTDELNDIEKAKRLSLQERPPGMGVKIIEIEAMKVSLGSKHISKRKDELSLALKIMCGPSPKLIVEFTRPHKKENKQSPLQCEISLDECNAVEGFSYYLPVETAYHNGDPIPPFIALSVAANKENNLATYSNHVTERNGSEPLAEIVVEVMDATHAREELRGISTGTGYVPALQPFLGIHGGLENELEKDKAFEVAKSIINANAEDRKRETRARTRSCDRRKSQGNSDEDNKVLLVWPFEVDQEEMERIAQKAGEQVFGAGKVEGEGEEESEEEEESLIEDKMSDDDSDDAKNVTDKSTSNANTTANTSMDSSVSEGSGMDFTLGGHTNDAECEQKVSNGSTKAQPPSPPFGGAKQSSKDRVTIIAGDLEKLNPGEFLNDNLIDFWMKWIVRGNRFPGKFKFFTSHFFSTLREEGVDAVKRWTKDPKGLLQRDFIFCPINESFHWSLAIICNPGFLLRDGKFNLEGLKEAQDLSSELGTMHERFPYDNDNMFDGDEGELEEKANEMLVKAKKTKSTCIIVLDSLRAHSASKIAKKLKDWLCDLVKAAEPNADKALIQTSLKSKSLVPCIQPKVPYQTNSWDCGVFVCQYGNAFYRAAVGGNLNITVDTRRSLDFLRERREFDFGMSSIDPLRMEMKNLIEGLGEKYVKHREEILEREKKEKLEKKRQARLIEEAETKREADDCV